MGNELGLVQHFLGTSLVFASGYQLLQLVINLQEMLWSLSLIT